jgi:hypothetical protein
MSIQNLFSDLTGIRAVRTWSDKSSNPGDRTLPVANFKQLDGYSCAAVSGFVVVETFYPCSNFDKFYELVDPDPDEGTSDYRLINALRKFRVRCSPMEELPGFDYVRQSIDQQSLILASVHLGDDLHHWVVVYGYGTMKKSVFLAGTSGFFSANRTDWSEFRKAHVASVGAIRCSPKNMRFRR